MPVLRAALLLVGAVALGGAVVVALFCGSLALILWLVMLGGGLVAGVVFERGRYKPAVDRPPGPGWVATDERFIDPASGKPVTVYYQPETGERRYVGR